MLCTLLHACVKTTHRMRTRASYELWSTMNLSHTQRLAKLYIFLFDLLNNLTVKPFEWFTACVNHFLQVLTF